MIVKKVWLPPQLWLCTVIKLDFPLIRVVLISQLHTLKACIWFVRLSKFREYFTEINNLEFSKIMEPPNETHQKVLNYLCRLCQQNIKLTSKYASAKGKYIYKEEISNCLIMIST